MRLDSAQSLARSTRSVSTTTGLGAAPRPERPLVYGKARTSVVGNGARVTWDRELTPNVDAEVELGVVIGEPAWQVAIDDAIRHVLGYTIVNDVSSRDEWLDGDQWLLGKSMPGFCPVGPVIVTADEFDPSDVRSRLHDQRRSDPGRAHGRHAVLHRRGHRLPEPPRPARAGRPDRDAGRRPGSPGRSVRTDTWSRATWSRAGSRASGS